jgi:DeoR family fructose operon transcriptional repressor
MIPYIRRQNILAELKSDEVIYVEELAKNLNMSVSTIRRDLKILVDEGQIVSLRGGAVKLKTGSYEIPLQTKQLLNVETKLKIAQYAASLVMDGEVIYIDSGTTTLYMLKYLKKKKITVVTSNTQAINELVDSNITSIILGGEISKTLGSVVGPIAEKLLQNMFFDRAFLGASGYSVMGGINTPDVREATKKEIVKNNSKITYVLVDSSKASITSFCKAFNLNECTIITDEINEILEKHANYVIV